MAVDEGCRWLWVRVNALPADAALRRTGTWSRQDEFLALLVERQEMWGAQLVHAWGGKPPDTITVEHPDRPREDPPAAPANDPEEISRFFAGVGR